MVMFSNKNLRLGLDIGTNSIGWCVLGLDANGEPDSIVRAGVRIFADGRDSKSGTTLKSDRRLARQSRRMRDRFVRRRSNLMDCMIKHGLMSKDYSERKQIEKSCPYRLRAKGLDSELSKYEMGRALFHINQRRGFKSNRLVDKTDEDGPVAASIARLEENLVTSGCRTFGEFLFKRRKSGDTTRVRRHGTTKTDLYDLYPSRSMYEAEFNLLWKTQQQYDPAFYTDALEKRIYNIIFFQRKLKSQKEKRGKCTFIPDEDRAPKALPSFQRFRIMQLLNNLTWRDPLGNEIELRLHPDHRDEIFALLNTQKSVSFDRARKLLVKAGVMRSEDIFNFESDRNTKIEGNDTEYQMAKIEGLAEVWQSWSVDEKDEFIMLVIDDEMDDETLRTALKAKYAKAFDVDAVFDTLVDAKWIKGYGRLSRTALARITEVMIQQGLRYWDAVGAAGFGSHSLHGKHDGKMAKLPYYASVLDAYVLPGSNEDADKGNDARFHGEIPNPTVHIALNQLRRVVNELIRLYGRIDEIVIEYARELPMGTKEKSEYNRRLSDNQKANEAVRKQLDELGVQDNRDNMIRMKLWNMLAKSEVDKSCVYCGKKLSLSSLFTDAVAVDHILPYARSLDDSIANKCVVCRGCNEVKGDRTPFEAFSSSEDEWQPIVARSNKLPGNKRWRFKENAMEGRDGAGFLDRHLNDARYIGKVCKDYLSCVVPADKIWVVTGSLTAKLRRSLEINGILMDHNSKVIEGEKNRNDHRHHAVDALVVGLTSRGMVQRASRTAVRKGDTHKFRIDEPWENFRSDAAASLNAITVSHKAKKKYKRGNAPHETTGMLHIATAYGISADGQLVSNNPVSKITTVKHVESIVDPVIRSELLQVLSGASGASVKTAIASWFAGKRIYHIRCFARIGADKSIGIRDKSGAVYKHFITRGNAYIDIYSDHAGRWNSEIVTRFDDNQASFCPEWQKDKGNQFVMRLATDECFSIETDDKERQLLRVQKITNRTNRQTVECTRLNDANVSDRNRDKNDDVGFIEKTARQLQAGNAYKVHISPTGLVASYSMA